MFDVCSRAYFRWYKRSHKRLGRVDRFKIGGDDSAHAFVLTWNTMINKKKEQQHKVKSLLYILNETETYQMILFI